MRAPLGQTRRKEMQTNEHFDVVIMGGGYAGNVQARHLLRKIPGIKIAVIDPRSDEKVASIHKIGESTVEIGAIFLSKELGLVDYMIENHLPKCGLAFHWPRDPAKTDTIDDYYSIWPPRFPKVGTFQVHRGKLERDLQAMNREEGVTFLQGKVKDFELTSGDAKHEVEVKLNGEGRVTLSADHLVDAASRAFLTGKKTDNIIRDPEAMYGLDTGAVWVRVKGIDRKLFRDGGDPLKTATSHYYSTNHWFGHGHWFWMIPICDDTMSISIGAMFHHSEVDGSALDRKEKFLDFVKSNHTALYDIIASGEIEDFVYWKKPSHLCKEMFSKDNWYAIGDAAYFGDAFYSLGTSTIAFAVESVTELIRAKQAGECPIATEDKREAYNDFNVYYGQTVMHLYRDHAKHLGNASAMSWRIYLEYMWWFGVWVPVFIGKWHLDPWFVRATIRNCEKGFFKSMYDDFTRMIDEGKSAGFIDCYRADQLAFGYCPTDEHMEYMEDSMFEPQRLDIFTSLGRTYFLTALFVFKYQWNAFGVGGVLSPRTWTRSLRLLAKSVYMHLGSLQHRFRMRSRPASASHKKQMMDFENYVHRPILQPWTSLPQPAVDDDEDTLPQASPVAGKRPIPSAPAGL